MNPIYQTLRDTGKEDLIDFLSQQLTESQLSSLLIEVFQKRAGRKSAAQILNDYQNNRFAQPSTIDPIRFGEQEVQLLRIAKSAGFESVQFSPLTPLGTVAAHQTVSQNHIVSATRRCEVVSDVTNVMALEMASRLKEKPLEKIHLVSAHRHVRAQPLIESYHTAHFKILAMASSWRDQGKMELDEEILIKHISTYRKMLINSYQITPEDIGVHLLVSIRESVEMQRIIKSIKQVFTNQDVNIDRLDTNKKYYQPIRFQMSIKSIGATVIDGGIVDWMSRLTQNKKRRMIISGMGSEIMYKMFRHDN